MRRFAAIIALLVPAFATHADIFLLADGSRYEGTAVTEGDEVTITTFDGRTIKIPAQSLKGTVGEPKRNQFHERLRALDAKDTAGRSELGEWALQNGLKTEGNALLQQVRKVDPQNERANKALGYELRDGSWQAPPDENLRIGRREEPLKPKLTGAAEMQALSKRLENWPIEAGPVLLGPENELLLSDARAQPELFTKLLIPPQLPGFIYGAKPEIRLRVAWLLGFTQDRRALQALVDACVYDADANVRYAAAKALAMLDEPVAVRKLVDIAASGDLRRFPWPLRKQAAEALRRYGDKEAVVRLLHELSFELAAGNPRDPKNKLRGRGAGIGTDNPLAVPESAPPDLGLPEHDIYPVLAAVKLVTRHAFESGEKDMRTWLKWWSTEGGSFQLKD